MARGPLETAKIRPKVLAWLAAGLSEREIVGKLARLRPAVKVTHQAVHNFARRHQGELAAKEERIETAVAERVEEVVIASKAARLRELQAIYDSYKAVLVERGPLAREPKWVTVYTAQDRPPTNADGEPLPAKQDQDGKFLVPAGGVLMEVLRVDKPLADVLVTVLREAAAEKAARPRPPTANAAGDDASQMTQLNVYIDNRKVEVRQEQPHGGRRGPEIIE